MSHPDPLQDYDEEEEARSWLLIERQIDEDQREWELMEALWAVHHAGLEEEATTLAYGCGLGAQFLKEIANAKGR